MDIDLLPGALSDLRELRTSNPKAHAVVAAFLQEAQSDNELLIKWTVGDGDIEVGPFDASVKRWVKGSNFIGNLFRIRVLNTPATEYRIVYGYDWHTQRIGLLAVLHKSVFDYEIKTAIANRIRSDWDFATGGRAT